MQEINSNNPTKITLLQSRRLYVNSEQKTHPKYDIHDLNDIKALEKSQKGKHKFNYDVEYNRKSTPLKLYIAPMAILGGRLGVYTDQDIKKSRKIIGCYAGKRTKRHSDASNLYVFEIHDKHGEPIEYIDANKIRDWTGFINHSVTPNLIIDQRRIRKQTEICFYPIKNIKKGEQLTYDYGKYYFHDSGIKPYYIHPSDNYLTADEVYTQHLAYYAPGVYAMDKYTCQDLKLGTPTTGFLLPSLFLTIYNNQLVSLKSQLKKSYPINLVAYACGRSIYPTHEQQHLTPFMFACYLGNERIIQTLMDHGADIDRCMLITGYSPFMLLLRGHAEQSVVEKMGMQLLRKMSYPLQIDEDRLSILHYAILRNSVALVRKILKLFSKEQFEWLELIVKRNKALPVHADFDHCLREGKFTLLRLMLKAALADFGSKEDSLIAAINKRHCFATKSLASIKPEYLTQFTRLLKQPLFRIMRTKTDILKRVAKAIRISTH